ncbi:MAG: DUF1844 domain-containing protein [Acidobacteriota bacterium]
MSDSKDSEEENSTSHFKVTDRRQFTPEGEVRQQSEEAPETEPQSAAPPPPEVEARPERIPEETPPETSDSDTPEGMNFASFLLSLATTGMVHLGEIPEPTTGQKMENLEAARQMIDILDILKVKTEGNLSSEETQLMENLLYELRMKFLAKSNVVQPG